VKPLSIGVAIAAAIALLAGIIEGNGGVLSLAADPTRLGVGVVGLMLAFTTFRSPLISPFLRVFSTIFAVEYVVTGLAYVAVQAGWWPPSFSGETRATRDGRTFLFRALACRAQSAWRWFR